MRSPSATRVRWRRWIEPITTSVTGLVLGRSNFLALSKAMEEEGLGSGDLHQWLAATYGYSTAIAIRRLLDGISRTYSLVVLLREMCDAHQVLTRRSFVRSYRSGAGGKLPAGTAQGVFAKIAGPGAAVVPRAVINHDLRRLEKIAKRVKPVADKMIAHRDRRRGRLGARTINDLHDDISIIEDICRRYRLLLIQEDPSSFLPGVTAGRVRSDIYRLTHPKQKK